MKKIKIPKLKIDDCINLMIENAGNNPRVNKLILKSNSIMLYYFERKYLNGINLLSFEDKLFKFDGFSHCELTKKELYDIYEYDYKKNVKNKRAIYDTLRANYIKCPICSHNTTSELDHYLPKSIYPWFCIIPYNLVPMCHVCNNKKNNNIGNMKIRYFHPYFDDFIEYNYTECTLDEGSEFINLPLAVNFRITNKKQNDGRYIPNHHYQLIANTDKVYNLKAIYGENSVSFLSDIIEEIYDNCEEPYEVENHLLDFLKKKRLLSWKKSLVECLLSSEWFLNEYFLNIKQNYSEIYS